MPTRLVSVLIAFAMLFAPAQAQPAPYELNAILSLTGPAAFVGQAIQQDFRLIETLKNSQGGIRGRPLKFVFVDDQSNPQLAVQLANQVIASKAPMFFGGILTSTCSAIEPLVAKAGPIDYCLSPGVTPAAGSYVYSASANVLDLAAVLVRYFRLHGWTRIATITATDASGQVMDKAFAATFALAENKAVEVVAQEHFNSTDITIAAQAARIKSANPQAILATSTGTPFATLLRGFHDSGIDVPIGGGTANMTYAQMAQYKGFLPRELVFPGTIAMTEGTNVVRSVRTAQNTYFGAFRAANIRPDFANNVGWDPAMILVDALEALGPGATADQIQQHLKTLRAWSGINGVYNLTDGSQRGLSQDACIVVRWDANRDTFVQASLPRGLLK